MNQKSVCIMTSVHRHDDVRIYHKEAKALCDNGFAVTILCSDYEGIDKKGIRFIKVELPQKRMKRLFCSSRRFYRAAKELHADYYHFHDPELMKAGLKLSKQAKVIYDVHEDVPAQILTKPYLKPWFAKICSWVFERREKRIAKRLWAVVAAEPVIYLRMKHINRNTVQVCNFPILSELSPPLKQNPGMRKKVCYLGGITELRGIMEMLDAVAGTDIPLILAGDFETEELQQRAMAHPGWKNVTYLGFIGRKQVNEVLTECAAGLVVLRPIPKYLTALPVKMFEYMAGEVPVIASNFPYWKKILENPPSGICVDPSNPDEIRAAMQYLLKNADVVAEMGRTGRKKVENQYSWETEKQKLIQLYSC